MPGSGPCPRLPAAIDQGDPGGQKERRGAGMAVHDVMLRVSVVTENHWHLTVLPGLNHPVPGAQGLAMHPATTETEGQLAGSGT